ncbi:PASTA domain-containing protein [Corynebacterium sp. zg254]|uniref:non-specific serine/threonine protein kinase n=1 Tax=Corynebacterium zhongnanshanii TaxID=2768834 RepID=A0ABQ6VC57_9CORY|nr:MULTISPECIES: PASTA domain-containing protein [Corynebacterium]KAB3519154.1 serine/threonine protein kinase [Corynebacterium zhongnanshanii]MCR5914996.1 PASTA domain-containing protein [Corynebacterium sp. zg254]
MDRIGTTLGGRYRLSAKIGTGGMSVVYAATDELLGRDVAVKMMRPDLARDHSFLERFRREAQNAAKLNHQAIVAVYDTGETPEYDEAVPYIVMERVHGETLRDIIQDRGTMSLSEAATIMAQVCDALHFSHEAGIIHRDIKPANIMITNTGMVKVMDFGIARALSDSSSAMTQTAAVIGTAQYLSPEQARGKSADARSDIYAAGCVLFELATGQPPFQGESPFSVAFQHVQDQVKNPSSVPGMHLSKREALSLDSIILTSMAKSPSDRYDDAQQMATDLRRLADDQLPLVAQPYTEEAQGDGTAGGTGAGGAGRAGLAGLAGGAAGAAGAGLAGAAGAAGSGADAAGAAGGADNNPETTILPTQQPGANSANAYPETAYDQAGQNTSGQPSNPNYNHANHTGAPYGGPEEGEAGVVEEKDNAPRRSKTTIALWTISTLLLLGAGGYIGYRVIDDNNSSSNSSHDVTLPKVANKPRDIAEKELTNLGLKVTTEERPDHDIARGNAIGTDPGEGSTLPSGSTVTLLISAGKELTEVPDLTGMNTSEASDALRHAKLQLNSEVREDTSDDVPAGNIITQNPPQGTHVSVGTKVTITVSTGKEKATVPTVSGQDLDDARTKLEAAGFKVTVKQVDSPEPLNKVLSASGEGQRMERDSEITLTVSRNNQISMPNLTGMKYSDAVDELRRAGWTGGGVERTETSTNDLLKVDTVAHQSISAGTTIDKNAQVRVDVFVFALLP